MKGFNKNPHSLLYDVILPNSVTYTTLIINNIEINAMSCAYSANEVMPIFRKVTPIGYDYEDREPIKFVATGFSIIINGGLLNPKTKMISLHLDPI